MNRLIAVFTRRPLLWVFGSLALFWVVYVASALRPRLALPPLDTSHSVLSSNGNQIILIQTDADGKVHRTRRTIGPVTPWKKGLIYWDERKPCLFYLTPGSQKAQAIWLRPSFRNLDVVSLSPTADGVYLNVNEKNGLCVVRVHLPDGAAKGVVGSREIKSREAAPAYASRTLQKNRAVLVVHYANGKTRSVPVGNVNYQASWDYDPARDALVWLQNNVVCYDSPTRSWRKTFSTVYTVGFANTTGDVWVQTFGSFSSRGMYVLNEKGVDRGWRWRDETMEDDPLTELSPEREKLVLSLHGDKGNQKP